MNVHIIQAIHEFNETIISFALNYWPVTDDFVTALRKATVCFLFTIRQFIFSLCWSLVNKNIISSGLYLLQLMEATRIGQCFQSVQSRVVLERGFELGHATILHRGLVVVIAPGLEKLSKHSDVTWTHAQVWSLRYPSLNRKISLAFSVCFSPCIWHSSQSHSALPLSFRLKTLPLFAKKDMTVSLFSVYFIELFAKYKSVFYLEIALENTALEK